MTSEPRERPRWPSCLLVAEARFFVQLPLSVAPSPGSRRVGPASAAQLLFCSGAAPGLWALRAHAAARPCRPCRPAPSLGAYGDLLLAPELAPHRRPSAPASLPDATARIRATSRTLAVAVHPSGGRRTGSASSASAVARSPASRRAFAAAAAPAARPPHCRHRSSPAAGAFQSAAARVRPLPLQTDQVPHLFTHRAYVTTAAGQRLSSCRGSGCVFLVTPPPKPVCSLCWFPVAPASSSSPVPHSLPLPTFCHGVCSRPAAALVPTPPAGSRPVASAGGWRRTGSPRPHPPRRCSRRDSPRGWRRRPRRWRRRHRGWSRPPPPAPPAHGGAPV